MRLIYYNLISILVPSTSTSTILYGRVDGGSVALPAPPREEGLRQRWDSNPRALTMGLEPMRFLRALDKQSRTLTTRPRLVAQRDCMIYI